MYVFIGDNLIYSIVGIGHNLLYSTSTLLASVCLTKCGLQSGFDVQIGAPHVAFPGSENAKGGIIKYIIQ